MNTKKVRYFKRFNPVKGEIIDLIARNVQIAEECPYILTLGYSSGSPVNRRCEEARLVRQNKTLMRVKKWEV